MRLVFFPVASGLLVALALACGAPFSTATGGDASASDSGGEAAQGPSPEAGTDGALDGPPLDALEETPQHCAVDFECVPAVPAGWTGPLELYVGAAVSPTCPGAEKVVFDGMEGLQQTPDTCSCTCGSPCAVQIDTFATSSVAGCAMPCLSRQVNSGACFTSAACTDSTAVDSSYSLSFPAGGCAAQQTTVPTPLSWQAYARACAPALDLGQLDCAAGDVCMRKPVETAFQAGVCIMQAGAQTCPAGYDGAQHTEFTDDKDDRGCTPCTCSMAGSVACSATLYVYSTANDTCGGTHTVYDPGAMCISSKSVTDMTVFVAPANPPACTPSGAVPEGTATATGTTTFCCTQ